MQDERHSDVFLMFAGSIYTLFLHYAAVFWAWLPGGLTVIYVSTKLYYKIKKERLFWKEQQLRHKWEKPNEDEEDDEE